MSGDMREDWVKSLVAAARVKMAVRGWKGKDLARAIQERTGDKTFDPNKVYRLLRDGKGTLETAGLVSEVLDLRIEFYDAELDDSAVAKQRIARAMEELARDIREGTAKRVLIAEDGADEGGKDGG